MWIHLFLSISLPLYHGHTYLLNKSFKFLKNTKYSYFSFKKCTQIFLLKSSSKKYLFLLNIYFLITRTSFKLSLILFNKIHNSQYSRKIIKRLIPILSYSNFQILFQEFEDELFLPYQFPFVYFVIYLILPWRWLHLKYSQKYLHPLDDGENFLVSLPHIFQKIPLI